MPYVGDNTLLTVIESPLFSRYWSDYWTMEQHADFIAYVAGCPDVGDVIPGSGGCRKVRWAGDGRGKRGGVRVIYTLRLASGAVVLLTIHGKGTMETIPAHVLRQLAEELGHADDQESTTGP